MMRARHPHVCFANVFAHSEGGVVKRCISLVREIIVDHCNAGGQDPGPVLCNMSAVLFTAMRDMRLNPAVPDVFVSPANITGGGWRSIVEVAEVAMLALDLRPHANCSAAVTARKRALLRATVYHVCTWYFASCRRSYADEEEVDALSTHTTALRDALHMVEVELSVTFGCPKVHRLRHVAELVALYGPYDCLTAEMGEAAHQQFKRMFRWCVCPRTIDATTLVLIILRLTSSSDSDCCAKCTLLSIVRVAASHGLIDDVAALSSSDF